MYAYVVLRRSGRLKIFSFCTRTKLDSYTFWTVVFIVHIYIIVIIRKHKSSYTLSYIHSAINYILYVKEITIYIYIY